jgi:hypothetical protein
MTKYDITAGPEKFVSLCHHQALQAPLQPLQDLKCDFS